MAGGACSFSAYSGSIMQRVSVLMKNSRSSSFRHHYIIICIRNILERETAIMYHDIIIDFSQFKVLVVATSTSTGNRALPLESTSSDSPDSKMLYS